MPPAGPAACMIRAARPRHRTAGRFLPPHSLRSPPRASGHEEPKPRGNAHFERHGPDRQDPASVRKRPGCGISIGQGAADSDCPARFARPIAPDRTPMRRFAVIRSGARRPADGPSASRRRVGRLCRPRFSSCSATAFSMTRDNRRTRSSRIKGCSRRPIATGGVPGTSSRATLPATSWGVMTMPPIVSILLRTGEGRAIIAVRERPNASRPGSGEAIRKPRSGGHAAASVDSREGSETRFACEQFRFGGAGDRGGFGSDQTGQTRFVRRPARLPTLLLRRPTCADFRRSLRTWIRPPEDRSGLSFGRKRLRAALREASACSAASRNILSPPKGAAPDQPYLAVAAA